MRTFLATLAVALGAAALLAPASGATNLINESFTHGAVSNPNFLVGGTVGNESFKPCLTAGTNTAQTPIPGCPAGQPSIPSGGDPDGQGALRLTSNAGNSTGFILYESALPFTAGLDVTFSFFAYNGSGADGTTFFLSDGSKPLTTPGAFGGSLGYARRNTPTVVDGLVGGYVGVGFDEYGNFANDGEGRGQGCSNHPNNTLYPDRVTMRGPGSGQSQYCIVNSVPAGGSIDNPRATSRTAPSVKRTVHIKVDPLSQQGAKILVQIDFGSGMQTVMDEALPPNPPQTFKFGFAASTGGSNNIHEIQNVVIDSILPLPRLTLAKTNGGPFTAGGTGSFTLTASIQSGSQVGAETQPVTVSDDLPAGRLSGIPTGAGWDCSGSSGTKVRCTHPASPAVPIPPGTQLPPITVPVVFGPNESGIFTNTAQASSQDNANTPQDSSASSTFHVLPVGQDDFARTTVGVPVDVPILDNDHGNLLPGSVVITRQPGHGTAAWDVNAGQALYTPEPGWSGIDTFTYRVFDKDGQQLNQTVTITVTPKAQDDSGVTPVNTPITIDVLANDLGNLNPATVTVTSLPGHGTTKVDPATGKVTYTPAPGFTGRDVFTYTVRDHAGQLTSATVTIDVYAPPAPPPSPPPVPDVVGRADLVITKTVSPKVAGVGDILTYTVTVTNHGPDTAQEIVGTDASRGRFRVLSLTPSRGTCTIHPSLGCSVGQLKSGETVTVVARVRTLEPGLLVDTASVSAKGEDANTANDHARAVARIASASLTITKRASARRVQSGAPVSFTIRVSNHSIKAAHNVSVCDRLPSGLVYVSGGTRRGTNVVCWRVGSLGSGRGRTLALRARAVASHTRVAVNVATIRASGMRARTARAVVVILKPTPTFTG
jgi:uncharacterized repeat protein (TIGR01451 family)